jgi:endonuclease-3
MKPEKRRKIFTRLKKKIKRPKIELKYKNKFELLVVVILSAQATDVSVNKATPKLFAKANTPKKMLTLGETGLKKYIKTIGLYNTKAKNIIKASKILVEKYGSKLPHDRKSLQSLPGVGRKTANVILNTAFGKPTIAVDTHVFRLANRIGIAPGKTPEKVEENLLKLVPKKFHAQVSNLLILHGRYVCTAKKPKCPECVIKDLCKYKDKTK